MEKFDEEFQERGQDGALEAINPAEIAMHAISRYPLLVIGVTVLGIVASLLIGLSEPNTYKSVGMLLVRMGAREQMTPETAVNPDFETRGGAAAGDEMAILLNPALRERVVERVGAQRLLERFDARSMDNEFTPKHIKLTHDLQAWLGGVTSKPALDPNRELTPKMIASAVKRVADGTRIAAKRLSNTVEVSFTSDDPELSQLVASAYIKVLQERHREFFEISDSYSFVTERLTTANEEAEEARSAILAQRELDGIYNLQNRLDAIAEEIRELEAQNDAGAVEAKAIVTEVLEIAKQLSSLDVIQRETSGSKTTFVDGGADPASDRILETLPNLMKRRETLRDDLAELKRTFVESSRHFQREAAPIRSELASIEEQIQVLNALESSPVPVDSGLPQSQGQTELVRATLESRKLELVRDRESLQAAIKVREELLVEKAAERTRLANLEPIYTRLERNLAEKERRAAELEKAHTHSETLQLMDSDERMGNLQVTQEPFLPVDKEGPNRFKMLLMGIFGGLAVGLGIAMACQVFDPRLRYPKEAEATLGLRVLGVVPEQSRWRRAGKKLQSSMIKRI